MISYVFFFTFYCQNNADFKWDGSDSADAQLGSISFNAKKGDKIAIIGDVGSGKSSLIASLLGQIRQVSGEKVKVYGTTGYVPQQAWLLNMSIRDNILFGKEYDEATYAEVIRVCSLQRDLTLFVAGDKTELAERVCRVVFNSKGCQFVWWAATAMLPC